MQSSEQGPARLASGERDFEARFKDLLETKREASEEVGQAVAEIIAQVRREGDQGLIALTKRFDRFDPGNEGLRVDPALLAAAWEGLEGSLREALSFAKDRIESFHQRQMPEDLWYRDALGNGLGHRWTPIDAAGLYVPGGLAAYPSSVLMNMVPARVAGVDRLVLTVPAPDGQISPVVLAAAHLCGATEVYRIGGAQAVAALAYGTESIAKVDKIVGPGNAFVAAAKRQVFGQVGIDSIAGPSEILVVADGANDPAIIAADLLSQAEHDSAAQSILITDDAAFAERVVAAVAATLARLPRGEIAGASWRDHGAVLLVEDLLAEAPGLVDRLAPEHLELALADPEAFAERVRHAGAIFLGRHTPEVVGDYVGGPNHVLPTARSARFSSGLSVLDFMKRSSLLSCSPQGLAGIGPAAVTLAEAEGLDAHALSVALRLEAGDGPKEP